MIQLTSSVHAIRAEEASRLLCPPGVVLVEMIPPPCGIGMILLPDRVAADLRPDVGVVLAAGPGVELAPGWMVAVRPFDGQWIEGFEAGGYRTANQVRVFGKATPFRGETERAPWSESIPIRVFPEEMEMRATANNVVIKRQAAVTEESGIALPDSCRYRTGLAEVLSIGASANLELRGGRVKVGDLIHYDQRAEIEFAFADPDLAIVPDLAIDFVVTG